MAGSISKPMSVKEISEKAYDFEFNSAIALKYWLRTAETLSREAHIYDQEGNDQQAYFLLMRYAALVAEQLPRHPGIRDPENKAAYRAVQKYLIEDLIPRMEVLKPRIEARYQTWQKALERRREAHAAINGDGYGTRATRDPAASDPAVAGKIRTLAAADNSELAVKLAHNEIRRRETKRRATRLGLSEQQEQERRTAGLWDDWEAALSKKQQTQVDGDAGRQIHSAIDEEVRRDMEASRRRLDGAHEGVSDGHRRQRLTKVPPRTSSQQKPASSDFHYPSIPKFQPLNNVDKFEPRNKPDLPLQPYLPPKPPKERFEHSRTYDTSSPVYDIPPPRPEKVADTSPQDINTDHVAKDYTFEPSAYLENGKPLRTVFLPPTLRESFLKIAAPNTRNNLETCGMLCGTLVSNALFISQVVIPEQESTSDTCETINESAFFDYCATEDLMVLGWIHTHPSQTCFMSSRDLHTHCGYQIMMPESIAIVCAPSKTPSWGTFRLTDPPGMQSVLNCRKTGLFHPHDESNIYTDAMRPGHVFEAEGMQFKVVDLRPK